MPKKTNNRIDTGSFFPSPTAQPSADENISDYENTILQALQSKFESTSGIEVTVLGKDQLEGFDPIYNVWVWLKIPVQKNSHEKGLALLTFGVKKPEVAKYYEECFVTNALNGTNSITEIPQNILDEIKVLTTPPSID